MLSALGSKRYRDFFAAQAISVVGSHMQNVAILWLTYRLSNSALQLGIVAVAREFANSAIAPWAGVWADRLPKNRIVMLTQFILMLGALVLALLTGLNRIEVWHIVVLQLLLGLVWGVDMPVRNALLYDLIEDKQHLGNAIALHSALINLGRIIGPAIAGLLIAAVGEVWCFGFNALSFIGVIIVMSLMRLEPSLKSESQSGVRSELMQGIRYAFSCPASRPLLVLTALMGLFGFSYQVLLPVYARDIFNQGSQLLGFMNAAVAVGAIVGTALLASRQGIKGLEQGVFISAVVYGGSICAFAFSRWLPLSFVMLAGIGLGQVTVFASSKTLLQSIAQSGMRGRVIALYIALFMAAVTAGGVALGALAERWGAPLALGCGGIACMVAAFMYRTKVSVIKDVVTASLQATLVGEPLKPLSPKQQIL
jgi:MFS family permease